MDQTCRVVAVAYLGERGASLEELGVPNPCRVAAVAYLGQRGASLEVPVAYREAVVGPVPAALAAFLAVLVAYPVELVAFLAVQAAYPVGLVAFLEGGAELASHLHSYRYL